MKKMLGLFILASVLSACSNPVLKWIDTINSGDEMLGMMTGIPNSKEIISFSFGLNQETDLPIGRQYDISGTIPIPIILPEGTGVSALAPAITFIGKSLQPPSGVPQDFTRPVDYTVTAEDGSTAVYRVKVYVKGPTTKEIVYFALDVSLSGASTVSAEGAIDQENKTITIMVPPGTDLRHLTAHIAHTGDMGLDPLNNPYLQERFEFTSNFSTDTKWKVVAQDDSTQEYTLTVVMEKSHDKEIRSFNLGITGEEDIIGGDPQPDGKYPIVALVPSTGLSLNPKAPFIMYTGASISPEPETELDFTQPKTYTVTAEDGSTREYAVHIIPKTSAENNGDNIITGFYFKEPLVEGVIDQEKHTVALTVPAGTNLSALRPEIYYKGASVSPLSGQPRDFTGADTSPVTYTVRSPNGSQAYTVYVFTAPSPPVVDVSPTGSGKETQAAVAPDFDRDSGNYPVIIEFPTHIENPTYIENPVLTITYPAASAVDNETLNQILNQLILLQNKEVYSHITNETINNYITNSNTTNNTNYTEIATDVNVDVTVINPPPDNPVDPGSGAAASIDGFYFTNPAAVGEIDQGSGTISVTVPYGTALGNLTATIHYTGQEITGISGPSPVTNTRSFANQVSYTVRGGDGTTTKTYQVTVTAAPNNTNEMTAFAFDGITGTNTVISAVPNGEGKYPIEVTVPSGQAVTGLKAQITHNGASITGPNVNSSNSTVTAPAAVNYQSPQEYTITAQNGEKKVYTVTVRHEATDTTPKIDGFYFTNPQAIGKIDQGSGTISVTVPYGTDLRNLTATIYYTGQEITGISGPSPVTNTKNFANQVSYTVRGGDGTTTKTYQVTVTAAPNNTNEMTAFAFDGITGTNTVISAVPNGEGKYPIEVTVPSGQAVTGLKAQITHNGASITGPNVNSSNSTVTAPAAVNYQSPQEYTITAQNGEKKVYTVTVRHEAGDDAPQIDGFYFISPAAVGEIDQGSGIISVTVPYGTDLRNLTAGICYTGKNIDGVPGANPLKHTTSFNGQVNYTVKGGDGTSTKTYQVTVTAAPNNANEITALSFEETVPTNVIISAMPNAEREYPIDVTVASGTSFNALKPVISFNGASIEGAGFTGTVTSSSPVTATEPVDFSSSNSPVEYTVKDGNGNSRKYCVTVHEESNDDNPEITGFYFTNPLAVGVVRQDPEDTISVTVPSGANIRALAPTLYFNGASVRPASGLTNDFSRPVVYTVTGTSGKIRQYTVTVSAAPSSSKDITRFTIPGVPNSEAVIGAVPDLDGTYPVDVWVPAGLSLESVAPAITHTGVSVTPAPGTALNFNGPQTYTVTAEDGVTKTYKVTVNPRNDEGKILTSFIFNEVPVTGGAPVRVAGSIDQDAHTVKVTVPSNADLSGLVPTITYIGKSISESGGSDRTSNPFTGMAQDFGNSQTYTVKDQKGVGQGYSVTVTKQSPFTVSFTGETESPVINSNNFNQNTGDITVTAQTGFAPYAWYLDGVKQPVPDTQKVFSLNVGNGSFTPGRHEITVSGKKEGLHYTGKVYFEVSR